MHQIFASLKQVFHRSILLVAMLGLLISSLFFTQPSYAATQNQKLTEFDKMEKQSAAAEQNTSEREQDYEEQVKAAKDPDKVYEENSKEYKQANPGEGLVEKAVEKTEELVNKVTGK